jgi:hypothetical protein
LFEHDTGPEETKNSNNLKGMEWDISQVLATFEDELRDVLKLGKTPVWDTNVHGTVTV